MTGAPSNRAFTLTGETLVPALLDSVAQDGATVTLSADGMRRVDAARSVILRVVEQHIPVYGVTTGLGSKATEALCESALADFSRETLNGRDQTLGAALPRRLVRAAMAVRLNGFLTGASGVAPAVARHVATVFNSGCAPIVGELGSIGAADLLLGAAMGRAVMGLGGRMSQADGTILASGDALHAQALIPPPLGPRDGLALANHASFSVAAAALASHDFDRAIAMGERAAALTFLGFGANLSPLGQSVLALRPHPGDQAAAAEICRLLDGVDATARRLQDPIALRNAVHAFGAARSTADALRETATIELNGSSDNPAVLIEEDKVVSTGNYFTIHLAQACTQATRAAAGLGALSVGRMASLCAERLTGLPAYLADPDAGTNGFAPLLKLAEALLAELNEAATLPLPWPSINADGVENAMTLSFQAARALDRALDALFRLTALECAMAAQAVDLRGCSVPPGLADFSSMIRQNIPYIDQSRPLGDEIAALTDDLKRMPV